MQAVILAGGKGTRLAPLNIIFPKPLVPLDDRSILDIVIAQLKYYGFNELILSLGYLSELIIAYLKNSWLNDLELTVRYVREKEALGTVGSLSMISNLKETFLVMNGDILTSLDYRKLYQFHKERKADLTIAINQRNVKIDLGVLKVNPNQEVYNFVEKPEYHYDVSMGIYVYEPKVLEYIIPNKYLDFPELVWRMLEDGKKILGYRSDDYWLDLGSPMDYKKAQDDFKLMKDQLLPK